MPDFDIKHIKQQWQQQNVPQKYDNHDILKMLNHKSRNYVKYVFWISVAEFALMLLLNIYYIFQTNYNEGVIHLLEKIGVEKTHQLQADFAHLYFLLKIFGLLLTCLFVVAFYLSYKKIKIEENLKNFIAKIIKFRRTVNLFILMNILFLLASVITFTIFVSRTVSAQNIQLDVATFTGFLVGIIVATALGISLVWVYYRIVYGVFLKRLNKNLKQLQEIESVEEE